MGLNILSRVKRRIKGEVNISGTSKGYASETHGPLSSMLGPSGRITLASLKWYFQESDRADFIEFVQNPVLVGSALNAESISASQQPEEDADAQANAMKRNQTHIVNVDDKISRRSGPGTSLPYAIYPLIKRADAESSAGVFTIGRTKENDMSMKDMAISKRHAVIRLSRGEFHIADCGSTNGTRLNGTRVNDQPQTLQDKDVIALGNCEFTFLTPAPLHELLSKS